MRKFTEKEDLILIKAYQFMSATEMGKELGRDESAVRKRLKVLATEGKVDISKRFLWTKKEHDYIVANFYKAPYTIRKHIKLSKRNIEKRLDYLFKKDLYPKWKPFKESEIDYIKKNYNNMEIFELSKRLRRSESSIYAKGHELRKKGELKRKNNKEMINNEQMKYILQNYGKKTPTEIARDLGIHMMKVSVTLTKLRKDGIITEKIRYKYDHKKIANYIKNNSEKTRDQCSRELNVSISTIDVIKSEMKEAKKAENFDNYFKKNK